MGGFYSAVKNQFIPGLSILPLNQIKNYTNVIYHPIQETRWTNHLGLHQRLDLLNIDISGSVTVDIAAGKKLVAGGSFHYLDVEEVIDKIFGSDMNSRSGISVSRSLPNYLPPNCV